MLGQGFLRRKEIGLTKQQTVRLTVFRAQVKNMKLGITYSPRYRRRAALAPHDFDEKSKQIVVFVGFVNSNLKAFLDPCRM